MAYATTADLQTFMGRTLTIDETTRGQLLLDLASGLIDGYAPLIPTPTPEIVRLVCLKVAMRGFTNATGASQFSIGNVSFSYPEGISIGLLADELRDLQPYRVRAASVRFAGPDPSPELL